MSAGDVVLSDEGVTIAGSWLKSTTRDFMLDAPDRRLGGIPLADSPSAGAPRRALVHDEGDKLAINYNGDYPGGVQIGGKLEAVGNVTVKGFFEAGRANFNGELAATDFIMNELAGASVINVIKDLLLRIHKLEEQVEKLKQR